MQLRVKVLITSSPDHYNRELLNYLDVGHYWVILPISYLLIYIPDIYAFQQWYTRDLPDHARGIGARGIGAFKSFRRSIKIISDIT